MNHCCDSTNKKKTSPVNLDKIIPVLIAIFTILSLGVGAWAISQTGASSLVQDAQAGFYTDHFSFDWGQIPIKGGDSAHEFTIENRGTSKLELTNVLTSCSCTNAQIVIEGKNSPYFGMHSTSSWVGEIPPGKIATLRVVFDPIFHGPDAVGPIERLIAVETNDPKNSKLEFKLTGNVVK